VRNLKYLKFLKLSYSISQHNLRNFNRKTHTLKILLDCKEHLIEKLSNQILWSSFALSVTNPLLNKISSSKKQNLTEG